MNKVPTKKIGNDINYAGVADRLKEFREKHPRALVETKPERQEDGSLIFSARILMDKNEPSSAEATGTAFYSAKELEKVKSFEKLETISVGRALALLGYLNNGEVASSEEMEDFYAYKQEKIDEAINQLQATETLDDLKKVFTSLGGLMAEKKIIESKDAMKAKILILEETNEDN